MAVTHGQNIAAVVQIADDLGTDGESVNQIHQHANHAVAQLKSAWRGPDMERLAGEWGTSERQLVEAAHRLTTMSKVLHQQAQDQHTTSGGGALPGSPGGTGGPGRGGNSGGGKSGGDDWLDKLVGIGALVSPGAGLLGAIALALGETMAGHSLMENIKGGKDIKKVITQTTGAWAKGKGIANFLKATTAEARLAANTEMVAAARTSSLIAKGGSLFGDSAMAGRIAGVAGLVGKVSLAGTIFAGGMSLITGDGYSGWRGATSRVLGLGAVGGAGALLFASGALASTGVGAPIAAGLVAAYGLWEAGNWVVDNWDGISKFGASVGQHVADWTTKGVEAVADAGRAVADGVKNVAEGAANFVGSLIPKVSFF